MIKGTVCGIRVEEVKDELPSPGSQPQPAAEKPAVSTAFHSTSAPTPATASPDQSAAPASTEERGWFTGLVKKLFSSLPEQPQEEPAKEETKPEPEEEKEQRSKIKESKQNRQSSIINFQSSSTESAS